MKTYLYLTMWACCYGFGNFCAESRATEPTPPAKFLLLKSERLLAGEVERVQDQYRVRRAIGETWLPADQALGAFASIEQAYRRLQQLSNVHDPDEHLRLARWCSLNGLPKEAIEEAEQATKLAPKHVEAKRYLARLQESTQNSPPGPLAASVVEQAQPLPNAPLPPLAFEPTGEALPGFKTKIQPILVNACIQCHGNAHPGSFKLQRIYESGSGNKLATEKNLHAVLAQIDLTQPKQSPLLLKALTVHGGLTTQAPLKSRQIPAYQLLEDWVQVAVGQRSLPKPTAAPIFVGRPGGEPKKVADLLSTPPVTQVGFAATSPAPSPENKPVAEKPTSDTKPTQPGSISSPPPTARTVPSVPTAPAASNPASSTKPEPVDEFDPRVFNRLAFPEKK